MDKVYEEGNTVAFTCIALGGPDNSLQWQKDGEDFGGAIDGSENTLTLINITVFNDSGVYTCVASNAAGTGSASVSLNISPVFDLHPTSITTSNGTVQTFMCNAMAFPEPTYVWVRVGDDLPEMALGSNTSMLTLSPAVFGDQGEYFCNATSNGVTVSSNTATLTSELALQGLKSLVTESSIPVCFLQQYSTYSKLHFPYCSFSRGWSKDCS